VDIAECIRELEVVVRLFVPMIEPILMNKRNGGNSSSSSNGPDDGKKKEVMKLKDVQILRQLFIKLEEAILSLRLNPRDKDHYTDHLVRKPKELFALFQAALLTPETFPIFNQYVHSYVSSLAEVASSMGDNSDAPDSSTASQLNANAVSSLYTSTSPAAMSATNTNQTNEDHLKMLDSGMDGRVVLKFVNVEMKY
jgi:hypothetical protein